MKKNKSVVALMSLCVIYIHVVPHSTSATSYTYIFSTVDPSFYKPLLTNLFSQTFPPKPGHSRTP